MFLSCDVTRQQILMNGSQTYHVTEVSLFIKNMAVENINNNNEPYKLHN